MNKELGSYLDCTRFLAAFIVFQTHIELNWVGHMPYLIPIGNQCIAVLFLLSGFVIGHVTSTRETKAKPFLLARAARVYSVAIPTVALGFILDTVGTHYMPSYYATGSWPALWPAWIEFFRALICLTFLNEIWAIYITPGSLAPFWTLSYEVLYYLVFAAIWYLRGRRRIVTLILLALIVGPVMFRFLALWWMGFGLYKLYRRIELTRATARTIFYLTLIPWVLTELYFKFHSFGFGLENWPPLWPYYITGVLYSLSTIGFCFGEFSISRYTKWLEWLAGTTFTLYMIHFPLGRFVNGIVNLIVFSPALAGKLSPHAQVIFRELVITVVVLVVSIVLAEYTERRKFVLRRWMEKAVDNIGRRFKKPRIEEQRV